MLIDGDRLPLFAALGDDKLELSFIAACAQACSDACDDVCAAGMFVCATLLSVTPGCEHIAHAFASRSPLLGPSACGLRVAVQNTRLVAHVALARCTSTAAALAPNLHAITTRFSRLGSACSASSIMPVAVIINGVASVYHQRVLAGSADDCPQCMLPAPLAACASLIVDVMHPLLHVPDAAASSSAASALLRCSR
jgi:hypothetical protein